jgi:hypothetical protein
MTAATFDHQVGKSLEFFEQQGNEKTACARFIGALYFEARAESRMRPGGERKGSVNKSDRIRRSKDSIGFVSQDMLTDPQSSWP